MRPSPGKPIVGLLERPPGGGPLCEGSSEDQPAPGSQAPSRAFHAYLVFITRKRLVLIFSIQLCRRLSRGFFGEPRALVRR